MHLVDEFGIQCAIVEYVRWRYPSVRLNALRAGYYLSRTARGKAKAAGYSAGFPDLMILCARGGFHGLFIELKTEIGRPTINVSGSRT